MDIDSLIARPAPRDDKGDRDLTIHKPETWATGLPAGLNALKTGMEQMGPRRTARTLLRVNQHNGFDCQSCAWPDEPAEIRRPIAFCENGAKAVADEATLRRVPPEFFARHSISELHEKSDYWLGEQGRLTHPMVLRQGREHYEPITWEEAYTLIADQLNSLDHPDQAIFYTSGRTENETAFMLQLLARQLGTNNLPDCANMCHESSGVAMIPTVGVGKGTVTLDDVQTSDLIIIAGQNPGTNHPRMLASLAENKKHGGKIVAVNPLPEAGLLRFKDPQSPKDVLGHGQKLADEFVQVRLAGDLAFFMGVNKVLLEHGAVDAQFVEEYTHGYDDLVAALDRVSWEDILHASGVARAQIEKVAQMVMDAKSVIVCWALGVTQHRQSVATIQEIVNLLLLTGNIGRPGAGLCPVRGHSNVQGDRTQGITEQPSEQFLQAMDREFGITSPRQHGVDTVHAVRAMAEGKATFFLQMGGNFARVTGDSDYTEKALRNCDMTVYISTKLNGTHTAPGKISLILPTLGRTELDMTGGKPQRLSVEDSMSMVHATRGRLKPASNMLRSEPSIIAGIAKRTFPLNPKIDWDAMEHDYDVVRDHISRIIPGFENFNERLNIPGGFQLPNGPRDSRTFNTPTGKANFTASELDVVRIPEKHLLLQISRSHDQFNSTIYGLDDRYRGIAEGRRVIFVNPDDIARLGLSDGQIVDITSIFEGEEHTAVAFRIVSYPTARDCALAYFPEANVLVHNRQVAKDSYTPVYKSVVIRLEPTKHRGPVPLR
ncbi:FdhF/YdeP family oxidoreductase [Devriesea agamarum]|uniref:FdhF/YdeP family oxidoreductase n=1 Tax=Devriesea agamarum TaxID=472569 RepID=UPI000A04296F|nr:FdhF/YdeP family oxidoreductase [Devriesea agamarum]